MGEIERGAEHLPAFRGVAGTPQRGTQVCHGAGVLQPRGGFFQHDYSPTQQPDPPRSVLCEPGRTQRDPERTWGPERLGERDLLGRKGSSLSPGAERELSEGGVRAPRRARRARAVQPGEELAGGKKIVERRGRA